MGFGIETVAGFATAAGAGTNALTYTGGQSGAVRDASEAAGISLSDMWAKGAAADVFRIRSPRLHDLVSGIGFPLSVANSPLDWLSDIPDQPVVPNDTLIAEIIAAAAGTDVGAFTLVYSDLGGIAANTATAEELKGRIKNLVTVHVTVAGAATLGNWSNGTAINATEDKLHADSLYAIFGIIPTNAVAALAIAGADTGNLRIGHPGSSSALETRDYFWRLSVQTGEPVVPLIKANNKGSTLIYQVDNAAGANNDCYVSMAELI
ncbi:MAG TPA: hypothetical protein VIX86_19190 [Streptosporangiaceae bacterium]